MNECDTRNVKDTYRALYIYIYIYILFVVEISILRKKCARACKL